MLELGVLAALFVGVFLEGEIILLSAVIAAHHGHMELWPVIIIGFVASISMDLTFYIVGRSRGAEWIVGRRSVHERIAKAERILENNRSVIQWTYRFLPVLRTIIPILFGLQKFPARKFIAQSFLGSAVWSAVVVAAGLILGESIILMLGHLDDIELYIIAIGVVSAVYIGLKKYRRHQTIPA